jgi:hypothetical protein
MVKARRLFLRLEGRNLDHVPMMVAYNLLNPTHGLNWNNAADRVPKMRVEANKILRELRKMGSRWPAHQQQEEAESLIISLENYLTETAATAMPNTYNCPSNEDSNDDEDDDENDDENDDEG